MAVLSDTHDDLAHLRVGLHELDGRRQLVEGKGLVDDGPQPPAQRPITRSPAAKPVTASPAFVTSPAHSPPPGLAAAPGLPPSSSPRFRDLARTRTSSSPALGSGVVVSRSSTPVAPGPGVIH